jgi:hypothetical protein
MKRVHVHVSVDDLAQSTRFYSTSFAAEPTVVKADYVKWMLDESTVYGRGLLAKLKEVSEAACCAPTCCEPEAIPQSVPTPATAACCAR